MFVIKNKEVKAIENNLKDAREEIKELKEIRHEITLENEKLKAEKTLDKKEIGRLNRKIKRLESKLNDNI